MQGRASGAGVGARGEGGGHVRGDLLNGCATLEFVGSKLGNWMRLRLWFQTNFSIACPSSQACCGISQRYRLQQVPRFHMVRWVE
jgi:hypothetical protein